MTLAAVATAVACAAALAGLFLAGCLLARRRLPRLLVRAHPLAGLTALALIYWAVITWRGPRDLPLDAGALVLTLAFLGGGLIFALRTTRLPRPPFVILLHGFAALCGCALLIVGLVHVPVGG